MIFKLRWCLFSRKKCIHVMGNVNTKEAKQKLHLLTQPNIPIIRVKANKQLYNYIMRDGTFKKDSITCNR